MLHYPVLWCHTCGTFSQSPLYKYLLPYIPHFLFVQLTWQVLIFSLSIPDYRYIDILQKVFARLPSRAYELE